MKRWLALGATMWLAIGLAEAAQAPMEKTTEHPAPCKAVQLSLALDSEHGAFDGMSHSGTLLVLRNLGPDECTMPALPTLRFEDAEHKPVAIDRQAPVGMHPGPVMLPVGVPAGAELTASLRWVDGDVYGANNCASPQFLVVPVGGQKLTVALPAHMCGPKAGHPMFTQTPLRRDPSLGETGCAGVRH